MVGLGLYLDGKNGDDPSQHRVITPSKCLLNPYLWGLDKERVGEVAGAGVSFFRKRLYFSGKFDKMNSGPSFGIVSFKIEGFRGIKNASVDGIPADTKWIFLTGKNGGGKTSVLQALFVGLFGARDKKMILEDGVFNLFISLLYEKTIYVKKTKGQVQGGSSGFKELPYEKMSQKILGYGVSRLNISVVDSDKNSQSYSLFNSDGILFSVESVMKIWDYRSSSEELKKKNLVLAKRLKERVDLIKNMMLKLMPNLQKIEVDIEKDQVFYYEKDDEGNLLDEPKTFDQLASGNRSIIAMVGDMVIRLLEAHPDGFEPADLEGIVLIDELDVHLHPTWQKALPGLLSEIFPKIQFIASTHSPIPLLGAPKESVVLKVHQSSEAGITVEKLDIDVSQLLPNSLLTSPIFDFEDIIPTANTDLEDLHTEDNFEEAMANEAIKERLKKIAQTL